MSKNYTPIPQSKIYEKGAKKARLKEIAAETYKLQEQRGSDVPWLFEGRPEETRKKGIEAVAGDYTSMKQKFKKDPELWYRYLKDPVAFYKNNRIIRDPTDEAIDKWNLKHYKKGDKHKLVVPPDPWNPRGGASQVRQRWREDSPNHRLAGGRDISDFFGGKKWTRSSRDKANVKKELITFMLEFRGSDGKQLRVIEESNSATPHLHIDASPMTAGGTPSTDPLDRFLFLSRGRSYLRGGAYPTGTEVFGPTHGYVKDLLLDIEVGEKGATAKARKVFFSEPLKMPSKPERGVKTEEDFLDAFINNSIVRTKEKEKEVGKNLKDLETLLDTGITKEYFSKKAPSKVGQHKDTNLIESIDRAIFDQQINETDSTDLEKIVASMKKERAKDDFATDTNTPYYVGKAPYRADQDIDYIVQEATIFDPENYVKKPRR